MGNVKYHWKYFFLRGKVRRFIHESNMRIGSRFEKQLNEAIKQIIIDAMKRARRAKRVVVFESDLFILTNDL